MPTAKFTTASDALGDWREQLLTGEAPERWPLGPAAFDPVELGPGLVLLLGGAPGAGKTALSMQWTLDALRLSPDLRAMVANVETAPGALLDRQLARLSGIPLSTVRARAFESMHAERLDLGLGAIDAVADRLAFLGAPFDLANVAAAADEFGADLLVLDYAQRFGAGDHADKRSSVNALMDYLRRFADAGIGCIVLAAVGRTKDAAGRSSYSADGLGLASFRESSELEFGCDSAYMLTRGKSPSEALLRCLKNRHGEPTDVRLTFDGALQRFESLDLGGTGSPYPEFDDFGAGSNGGGVVSSAVAALWNSTPTATDGEGFA
jgi:replicative DNA helicase